MFIKVYRLEEDEALPREGDDMSAGIYWMLAYKEIHVLIASGALAPILFKGWISVFVLIHTQGFTGEPLFLFFFVHSLLTFLPSTYHIDIRPTKLKFTEHEEDCSKDAHAHYGIGSEPDHSGRQ